MNYLGILFCVYFVCVLFTVYLYLCAVSTKCQLVACSVR